MVKQGDRVKVGGEVVTVETSWSQGKHKVYKLTDGRTMLDLHLHVQSGVAEVLQEEVKPVIQHKPREKKKDSPVETKEEKESEE